MRKDLRNDSANTMVMRPLRPRDLPLSHGQDAPSPLDAPAPPDIETLAAAAIRRARVAAAMHMYETSKNPNGTMRPRR